MQLVNCRPTLDAILQTGGRPAQQAPIEADRYYSCMAERVTFEITCPNNHGRVTKNVGTRVAAAPPYNVLMKAIRAAFSGTERFNPNRCPGTDLTASLPRNPLAHNRALIACCRAIPRAK